MTELTRGEKAKQTRIARIGLEAYKAEQANKGRTGGANSVGQFKANPKIAKKAGKRSKRLPKAITKTPNGVYEEHGELEVKRTEPLTPTEEGELEIAIDDIARTQE